MQIAFLVTRDEVRQACQVLYRRLRSRGERATDFVLAAVAVVMLVASLLPIYRGTLRHWQDSPWPTAALFMAFAVQSWRQHHQFANQPDYSQKQTLEIGEDGISRATWPGQTAKLPWTKISQYAEAADIFLLASPWPWGAEAEPKVSWRHAWLRRPVLVILPKRAFGPGEAQQLCDLLDRKLSIWAKERSLGAAPQHSQL